MGWDNRKEKWLCIFIAIPKFSTLIYNKVKFIMDITVPFCLYIFPVLISIVKFRLVGITWFIHLSSYCQLLVFILQQLKILLSFVNFQISPCGNSNPGVYCQFHHAATQILVSSYLSFIIMQQLIS